MHNFSIDEYADYVREMSLDDLMIYADFEDFVFSALGGKAHDEEVLLEWFDNLQDEDLADVVDALWRASKLDDELQEAQDFNFQIDKGEALLEQAEHYRHVPII